MRLSRLPYLLLSKTGFYQEHEVDFRRNNSADSRIFYVIRRANCWGEAGFFSNYFYVLSHYAHARRRGFLPVVDMRNYHTLYTEKAGFNGEKNAWNYYFQQPHTTRDAYTSRHFILSDCSSPKGFYPIRETDSTCELNPDVTPELLRIAQNELPIRPDLRDRFLSDFNSLFAGKRVLGVHFRGGDKRAPPSEHRRAVSEESLIATIRDVSETQATDAIFLASDESGIAELIQTEISIPVVQLQACRLSAGSHEGLHLSRHSPPRDKHRYHLGLEVLRDAWFLSRCDYLVCGHSNVTNAALFWKGEPYRNLRIIDTGAPMRSIRTRSPQLSATKES